MVVLLCFLLISVARPLAILLLGTFFSLMIFTFGVETGVAGVLGGDFLDTARSVNNCMGAGLDFVTNDIRVPPHPRQRQLHELPLHLLPWEIRIRAGYARLAAPSQWLLVITRPDLQLVWTRGGPYVEGPWRIADGIHSSTSTTRPCAVSSDCDIGPGFLSLGMEPHRRHLFFLLRTATFRETCRGDIVGQKATEHWGTSMALTGIHKLRGTLKPNIIEKRGCLRDNNVTLKGQEATACFCPLVKLRSRISLYDYVLLFCLLCGAVCAVLPRQMRYIQPACDSLF